MRFQLFGNSLGTAHIIYGYDGQVTTNFCPHSLCSIFEEGVLRIIIFQTPDCTYVDT